MARNPLTMARIWSCRPSSCIAAGCGSEPRPLMAARRCGRLSVRSWTGCSGRLCTWTTLIRSVLAERLLEELRGHTLDAAEGVVLGATRRSGGDDGRRVEEQRIDTALARIGGSRRPRIVEGRRGDRLHGWERQVDEREGGHLLRLAVLEHREVPLRQVADEGARSIGDEDVHFDEGDLGAEDGRVLVGNRILGSQCERRHEQAEQEEARSRDHGCSSPERERAMGCRPSAQRGGPLR
jgi:hypothetical protein